MKRCSILRTHRPEVCRGWLVFFRCLIFLKAFGGEDVGRKKCFLEKSEGGKTYGFEIPKLEHRVEGSMIPSGKLTHSNGYPVISPFL